MKDEMLRKALAEIGRRGGKAKTDKPKGLAALSPERRAEISRMAVAAKKNKREKLPARPSWRA